MLPVPLAVSVELSMRMYDLAGVAGARVGEFGEFEPVERGLGASPKDMVDSRDLELWSNGERMPSSNCQSVWLSMLPSLTCFVLRFLLEEDVAEPLEEGEESAEALEVVRLWNGVRVVRRGAG